MDPGNSLDAISLDRVSFTYADTATPALRDVSLQVRSGEMIVIIGASGSGKSTLVKCLNRVIPAFQAGLLTGDIRIGSRLLLHEKVGELAGTVGMVFQDFEAQLFATTVRDEILFGMEQMGFAPSEMQRRLDEALSLVGLSGFESRDPTTLSGGQKQRLAIAALLALRPHILVLDEPTTDLDPQGRQEIFSLLAQMRGKGHTLILVEHELSAAVDADRVVLLSGGQIIASDRPDRILPQVELLTRHGVRPRDIDRVCQHLGMSSFLPEAKRAVTLLQKRFSLSREKLELAGAATEQSSTQISLRDCQQDQKSGSFLDLQAVSFAYPGDSPVVREVSLSIREGEFIALLGQNGSGKTTLAKMMSGLLSPSTGQVLLQKQDLNQISLHTLAQQVSYVFRILIINFLLTPLRMRLLLDHGISAWMLRRSKRVSEPLLTPLA